MTKATIVLNRLYSKKDLSNLVIFPKKESNKYSRGTCIVVAGSEKYPGAAILASCASQKIGAGYTKLFTHKNNIQTAIIARPSIPVDSFQNIEFVNNNNKLKPAAYVVGCGFIPKNNNLNNLLLLEKILKNVDAPVVIDGGALSLLVNNKIQEIISYRYSNGIPTIITPHFGEAKKILNNKFTNDIKINADLAGKLCDYTHCVVILKGPNTIICDSFKYHKMNLGTPALAKAGTGDVLAGILGGLLCQDSIDVFDACVFATYIHALAGNIASQKLNTISVIPEDIINFIPFALNNYRTQ